MENLEKVKSGKYMAVFCNWEVKAPESDNPTYEIWQIYQGNFEKWDEGITSRDEALEVWRYSEKHYMDI